MTGGPLATARSRAVARRAALAGYVDANATPGTWIAAELRINDIGIQVFRPGEGFGAEVSGYLDRVGRLIYLAHRLDPGSATVATAHELGHFHLHGEAWHEAHPTASGIATRGYSDREVRELEADAYAAEFLLPTESVRAYLRGGRGASEIAEATGLPLAIVVHQASLALQSPPPRHHGRVRAIRLDDVQAAAVATDAERSAVEGRHGTGKTTMVAARLERLVAQGIDPTGIVVIAPTSRGAAAVRALVADPRALAARFGTCRAFALDLLLKWPSSVGRTPAVRLLDETAALAALERAARAVVRTEPSPTHRSSRLKGIIALKEAMRSPAETIALESAAGVVAGIGDLYARYDEVLERNDAVDVGDLPRLAGLVLARDSGARVACGRLIRHVLVDDLHDLDAASISLLHGLAECGPAIWATCNPSGTVFGYRGAIGVDGAGFNRRFGGDRHALATNHRSTAAIADAIERFEAKAPIPAGRATADLHRSVHPSDEAEADAVVARIVALRLRGFELRSQAVLARSRRTLDLVARRLVDAGLAADDRGGLGEREDVQTLLADVATAASRRQACDDRLGASAPEASLHALLAERVFEARGPEDAMWTGTDRQAQDTRRAIGRLLAICREQDEAQGGDLQERLRRLRSFNQLTAFTIAERTPDDAVAVMTMHAAAGTQYRVVHLIGMAAGLMPATRHSADARFSAANPSPDRRTKAAAEERLMAMAMATASEQLHVSRASTYSKRSHAASDFFLRLGGPDDRDLGRRASNTRSTRRA